MGKLDRAAVARLARKQRGYITRRQLIGLGLSRHQIMFRIQEGQLLPVYSGIYAVGHVSAAA